MLNHVVLTDTTLRGPEYGVLRDFEDEVVRITRGQRIASPKRKLPGFVQRRIAHGTRLSGIRAWVPPARCELKADVLWVILMGPEAFTLDLFHDWERAAGFKILYLFDTMEKQLPSIRRVLQSARWDLTVTSFQGAIPFLEEHTQREWHCVPQGVKLERFHPADASRKVIDFCAYGRRLEKIHNSIKQDCFSTGKQYDYTIAASLQNQLDPVDCYQIYSWHLAHAIFNFCWPVEVTHPERVLSFSPITCRWFEAAASGNVIVGQAPQDPGFTQLFGPNLVVPINRLAGEDDLLALWHNLWQNRHLHLQSAWERRAALAHKWSWESRVLEILKLINAA